MNETTVHPKRPKPVLLWFGLTAVVLPAFLGCIPLVALDYLWFSSDRLSSEEMSLANNCLRLDSFLCCLILTRALAVHQSNENEKAHKAEARLSPKARTALPALHEALKRYYREAITVVWNSDNGPLPPKSLKDKLLLLFPSPQGEEAKKDYTRALESACLSEWRNRQMELAGNKQVQTYALLKEQFKDQPNSKQILADLQRFEEIAPQAMSAAEQDQLSAFSGLLRGMTSLKLGLSASEFAIARTSAEKAHLVALRQKESDLRRKLETAAYSGWLANVFLAILLMSLYITFINKRFIKLMRDAGRLARIGPVLEPLRGDDELSYLHRVLAEVNGHLNLIDENRKFITGMVAHDVRSPLMSTKLNLALAASELSSEPALMVQSLEKEVSSTVAFVEEMLAIEKQRQSCNNEAIGLMVQEQGANRASSLFRSGVFQKILLMVLLPLAVQTLALCWLNGQLEKRASLASQQQNLAALTIDSAEMMETGTHAFFCRTVYFLSGTRKYKEAENADWKRLAVNDLVTPGKLVGVDASVHNECAELLKQFKQMTIIEREGQFVTPSGEKLSDLLENLKLKMAAWLPSLDRQQARINETQQSYQNFAMAVQRFIFVGLLMQVVLAALMLTLFWISIKRRLSVLMQSASSLVDVKSTAIEVKVGGRDELAQLGDVLNSAREQLRKAAEERAEVIAGIVKRMSMPLTVARKRLKEIISDIVVDQSIKEDLAAAEKNIGEVLKLINGLLTVETLDAGVLSLLKESCQTKALVEEAVSMVDALADRKAIRIRNDAADILIVCDSSKIIQVLVNLLSNAIKFSPEKTEIKVSSSETIDTVKILVKDQGPGMSSDEANLAFERFYQGASKQAKQGFGIGLSVCKKIVELHDGKISLETEPGKGSTFSVCLPKGADRHASAPIPGLFVPTRGLRSNVEQ